MQGRHKVDQRPWVSRLNGVFQMAVFEKWAPHGALFAVLRLAPMGRTHSSHAGVMALATCVHGKTHIFINVQKIRKADYFFK